MTLIILPKCELCGREMYSRMTMIDGTFTPTFQCSNWLHNDFGKIVNHWRKQNELPKL